MLPASFPETTWGLAQRLRETAQRPVALAGLCQRYWQPVFLWVRAAWRKSEDDARDLTQAFFLWLLEGDALSRYAPQRGGFRPYLKVLLRRFVGHHEAALKRLKRGGGETPVVLDDDLPVMAEEQDTDPGILFDRAWVRVTVQRSLAAVAARLRANGRGIAFTVYESYEFAQQAQPPTYAALAARLQLTEQQVKHHLFEVREAVRAAVRAELRDTTGHDGELEQEWRELFGR